jgi:hypothetical protein
MHPFIPYIAYAIFCSFFALLNAIVIKRLNEVVLHWFNGLLHLTTVLYFGMAVDPLTGATMLFIARLFFDVPLNLFRKLPIGYLPLNPKSIVDRFEIMVFGKDGGTDAKLVYCLILIMLLVLKTIHPS